MILQCKQVHFCSAFREELPVQWYTLSALFI